MRSLAPLKGRTANPDTGLDEQFEKQLHQPVEKD